MYTIDVWHKFPQIFSKSFQPVIDVKCGPAACVVCHFSCTEAHWSRLHAHMLTFAIPLFVCLSFIHLSFFVFDRSIDRKREKWERERESVCKSVVVPMKIIVSLREKLAKPVIWSCFARRSSMAMFHDNSLSKSLFWTEPTLLL